MHRHFYRRFQQAIDRAQSPKQRGKGSFPSRLVHEVQDLNEIKSRMERIETQLNRPIFDDGSPAQHGADPERKQAINTYLRKGEGALNPHEVKLLSVDSDPQGGYWVTSEISQRVITQITESSPLRHLAAVETTSTTRR
ncbi:HK97 family phage major capsid protein [Nitrospina gracilis]|nr:MULTISPECIES: phage major capsid protein [Nitrospina]MCF8722961.1 HK97 family phage major capsid protein [Nitrospina sp. Nb-3]